MTELIPWVGVPWLTVAVTGPFEWFYYLVAATDLVIRIVALGVIPGNRRPSSAMAWLLLILFAPLVGILLYSLLGTARLDRRRHRRQAPANEMVLAEARMLSDLWEGDSERSEGPGSVSFLNQRLSGLPVVHGNEFELIPDYEEALGAMAEAVRGAREFVNLEFYIATWDDHTDELFTALADAADRGVRVRVLFDHIGSWQIRGYRRFLRRLRATGIEWHRTLPINPLKGRWRRPDLRNHRKILVVDNEIGFTGSQNLVEPGYHRRSSHRIGRRWVDLMARYSGGVVSELDIVFAFDWFTETGEALGREIARGARREVRDGVACQVVPSGPGLTVENNLRLFTTLVYSARRRLSLTSPYFVPDESLLYAVTTAAQRGVEVELFVSEKGDHFWVDHAQRSYYQALLDAGVRIRRYHGPHVLHAKHMTVDDEVAVLGSSNMDMRSFALNYEVTTVMYGERAVAALRRVEDGYRERSRELTAGEWRSRPLLARYVDNVARLTAALQ